jgi:hypothetical protein
MSNDRINELPICAKLLYRPQIICDGRVVAESDCVNPDGLEAAAIIKELVEACGPLVHYHATGGHEGDGSDAACKRAEAALAKARAQ